MWWVVRLWYTTSTSNYEGQFLTQLKKTIPLILCENVPSLIISMGYMIEFEVGLQALFVFGWFYTRIDSEDNAGS